MLEYLVLLGDFGLYSARALRFVFSRRYRFQNLLEQLHRIGVESLTVVNLCALFIGLVLVFQTYFLLARFGAKTQIATIVSAAFVREIGPVFAAIMFAGRVGTGVAAELGSMVVTEQVDAYRAFGIDPVGRLAVPRILATAVMLPALTVIADVIGIFSGFLVGVFQLGIPGDLYLETTRRAIYPIDVLASVTKGLTFGVLLGLVATYLGLNTRRATEAVGESTTRTMVAGVLVVLAADLVLTRFFLAVGE